MNSRQPCYDHKGEAIAGVIYASSLYLLLLLAQVSSGLYLTHRANVTNTLGLGWIGIAIWLVASTAFVLLLRSKLPLAARVPLAVVSWPLAYIIYGLIGYHFWGWGGLLYKG